MSKAAERPTPDLSTPEACFAELARLADRAIYVGIDPVALRHATDVVRCALNGHAKLIAAGNRGNRRPETEATPPSAGAAPPAAAPTETWEDRVRKGQATARTGGAAGA